MKASTTRKTARPNRDRKRPRRSPGGEKAGAGKEEAERRPESGTGKNTGARRNRSQRRRSGSGATPEEKLTEWERGDAIGQEVEWVKDGDKYRRSAYKEKLGESGQGNEAF